MNGKTERIIAFKGKKRGSMSDSKICFSCSSSSGGNKSVQPKVTSGL